MFCLPNSGLVDCSRVWALNRKKDLPPAVDFDILGIIKWPEFLRTQQDVKDYNAIRARSSTEELTIQGFISN